MAKKNVKDVSKEETKKEEETKELTPEEIEKQRIEDFIHEQDPYILFPQKEGPRVINKKIPWWILIKILFLTFLLFASPIFVYFYTEEHYFKDEPMYSAICAVVAVNCVLVLYIIVAALSDTNKGSGEATKEKKNE